MNEWIVSDRILVFAQRFLGSPKGKHCNSLEINVWRKVVSTSKKGILERDQCFFTAFPPLFHRFSIINGWRQCWFEGSGSFFSISTKYTDGRLSLRLLWNRHRVIVSTFYKISHKSLRNNSMKSLQFYLCIYSLFSYFSKYQRNKLRRLKYTSSKERSRRQRR